MVGGRLPYGSTVGPRAKSVEGEEVRYMAKLKPPAGSRDVTAKLKIPKDWIDTTEEHIGKAFVMFPAEMRDGVLFPGSFEEIDEAEIAKTMREWLRANKK
jgi:hypothetical protein